MFLSRQQMAGRKRTNPWSTCRSRSRFPPMAVRLLPTSTAATKSRSSRASPGAKSKDLLVRDDDVQVLHGFDSTANAEAYLKSSPFQSDVVTSLSPLLAAAPDVRVYTVA
jgi:hypothetical protein